MDPIDWSATVKALLASGMTQPQVAAACMCGQSTISDILTRRTLDPRVSLAFKLLRLAHQRGVPVANVPTNDSGVPLVDLASVNAGTAPQDRDAA